MRHCLLLQLNRKNQTKNIEIATEILENHFDLFSKKHFEKIKSKLSIDNDGLKDAISEIEKLNPKPGGAYNENTKINSSIVPDFTIRIIEGELKLELNSRNAPELHVSQEYRNMLEGYNESKNKSKSHKDAVLFIKQKLDSAKWFIDAIKQRNQTLIMTMSSIINFQKEYFLSGDETKIKPMILKDIAEEIDMDISTISRVANSKYVDTPYGTKLIKSFFSEGIKNSKGEEISTIEVKKILEEIINQNTNATLASISRKFIVFSTESKIPYVFDKLIKEREHISLIIDKKKEVKGIVTMEDIIETLLGYEIMDETDKIEDMQAYAKKRMQNMNL